ncbi:MAG: GAP family protein [Streptosporangiaceae bacterium]
MLVEAAGLAFLAALTPTVVLIAAAYLGSATPRRTSLFYLAGAVVMSVVIGVIVIVALHTGHLSQPRQRTPRYGLRLGLGIVAAAASIVMARRHPKPAGAAKKKPGPMARLMERPSPLTAFLTGLIIFAPSVTFIAAVQVIATSKASDPVIAGSLALIVAIDVLGVWVPYVLYLIAPDLTTRKLKAFDHWLAAHKQVLLVGGLAVAGLILTLNGILGLAGAV